MRQVYILLFFIFCFHRLYPQVVVIGGGASGTAAALQAARMGVEVHLIEETSWLGGMLTSAGVSAFDGNHNLPSGIFGEFRDLLYRHYGGSSKVNTGWVSNTLFEPGVGAKIFKELIFSEPKINVHFNSEWRDISFNDNHWSITFTENKKVRTIQASILIDATELGDVASFLKYPSYIGMDDRTRFGEENAPDFANSIIQDLTFVAILKDFGPGADKTIPKPKDYDSGIYKCACSHSDPITDDKPLIDCEKMLSYGRLPGNKYMINWPNCGNDYYLNVIELSKKDRSAALEKAKLHTLGFIYFIQTELGYKHLGLTDDDFPTADHLPMLPYHRESRRLQTEVSLSLPYVEDPYSQKSPLYRTGIAVGDYPIDHHHKKNPTAPSIDFIKIRVPSYNIPLGVLVPKGSTNFIIAEKSIGVSNIVNGTTRLQPVVLGIGQAAGALAATSIKANKSLQQISVRSVQQGLLSSKAYLMPFMDVDKNAPYFEAVQRIGATGILKGKGVPYKWANQTWFYPDAGISEFELVEGLRSYFPAVDEYWSASGQPLTFNFFKDVTKLINPQVDTGAIETRYESISGNDSKYMNRWQVAVLLDEFLKPFELNINWNGFLTQSGLN